MLQEVAFKEAFWPLYGMDEAEPITFTNIALRASFALLAAGVSWLLYANAPDKGVSLICHDVQLPLPGWFYCCSCMLACIKATG